MKNTRNNKPCCADCGWGQDLKEVNGVLLCRDCREEFYFENCQDKYWDFISGSQEEKQNFALNWWFRNLPKEVQGEIAFQAFRQEFGSNLPQILNMKESEICGYVRDHADRFADYIERTGT